MEAALPKSPPPATGRSAFVVRNLAPLRAWADALAATDGTIVAIARKGPRLLELLATEGILSAQCLSRVVSERALPFLSPSSSGFVVIDDAVAWGTTFASVVDRRHYQRLLEQSGGKVPE